MVVDLVWGFIGSLYDYIIHNRRYKLLTKCTVPHLH